MYEVFKGDKLFVKSSNSKTEVASVAHTKVTLKMKNSRTKFMVLEFDVDIDKILREIDSGNIKIVDAP